MGVGSPLAGSYINTKLMYLKVHSFNNVTYGILNLFTFSEL